MNATNRVVIVKSKKAQITFGGERGSQLSYGAEYTVWVDGLPAARIVRNVLRCRDIPTWSLYVLHSAFFEDGRPNNVYWFNKKFLVDYAMRRWNAAA